jgi:beta-barrel assembly-enhancing protease
MSLNIKGTAHEQSTGIRTNVNWKISGKGIEIFANDEKWCEGSWSEVKLNLGGSDGRIIFLTFPKFSDYVFSTADHSWLKSDMFFNNQQILELQKGVAKGKKWPYVLIGLGILVLVVVVWALFFLKGILIETLSNQKNSSWEKEMGDSYISQMKQSGDLMESDSLNYYFEQFAGNLISEVEKTEGVDFTFHFSKDTSINAFAMPGGHIVIQEGLVRNAKTAEEVLGVVGHEMAHVTKRHVVKGMLQKFGTYLLLQTVFGEMGQWSEVILNGGTEILSLSYSREMESEADEWGVKYLKSAGVNPQGLIAFFQTLNKHYGEKETLVLLSTHPPTKERINQLKKLVETDGQKYKSIEPKLFVDFQLYFKNESTPKSKISSKIDAK